MQGARCFIFTYVYEVRPVLAGHAETEIPPEARVFLNHLQEREKECRSQTQGQGASEDL